MASRQNIASMNKRGSSRNASNNSTINSRSKKSTKKSNDNFFIIVGKKAGQGIISIFKKGINKPVFVIGLIICLLVISLVILYGPAKTFYLASRENDKLQAQYASITETNEKLQKEIDYLQTEEGIKDRANQKLGLIESGESAGSVSGLSTNSESSDSASETSSRLKYKQIKAPEKWYTPFCNFIFGVNED